MLVLCCIIIALDPPNEPQFTQCISYNNNEPALQVLSYVRKFTF